MPASQGLNNNRAGATTWRMMGPRLVHLALPTSTPYTHPDSQTHCSLLLAPCTLVPVPGPVLNRTPGPAKLDTLHFPFCNSTVPLYATTVPTLSILNLVVFPSTVADHPSLGGLLALLDRPWAWSTRVLLFSHDLFPSPPPYPAAPPPSPPLYVARAFIAVDHRPPASVPPASSVCGFVIGRPEPRREASL